MKAARLDIDRSAYSLLINGDTGWRPLAALAGGATALLPGESFLSEFAFEHAIQVAEDWLMPHAAQLSGCVLSVRDNSGYLGEGLGSVLGITTMRWRVDEIESMFGRVIDLATGRIASPALEDRRPFVADLLLLRELAHHGKLEEVRLDTAATQSEITR